MMRFSLLANLSIFRDKLVGVAKKSAVFAKRDNNDQMAIFHDVTATLLSPCFESLSVHVIIDRGTFTPSNLSIRKYPALTRPNSLTQVFSFS
jgi:hypothetical protein